MVFISKWDKKIWDEYILNFQNMSLKINNQNLEIKDPNKIYSKQSNINYKLLKKGKIKPDGIIDLHGYKRLTGKIELQKYIVSAYENNYRNILVITGKGTNNNGVLKKEVPTWLNNEQIKKFIITFEIAPKNFGGDGAILVRIKNKYKVS